MEFMENEVSKGIMVAMQLLSSCHSRKYQDKAIVVTVEYLYVNMLAISVNIAVAVATSTNSHFLKNK